MTNFRVQADFSPTGDQPAAIEKLARNMAAGQLAGTPTMQTLLGATGTGKTFTVANLIQKVGKPTLVLSHNKTLAAQLYGEFRSFFPENKVGYFVSYFDYYQPESYIPATDTYIEKDSKVNATIERLRLAATANLMSGRDVVIVATVSAIYGLGNPTDWKKLSLEFTKGQTKNRQELLRDLISIQYDRNDVEMKPGTFRAKGDTIDVWPAYAENMIRFQLFGDEIEHIYEIDAITSVKKREHPTYRLFPAKHYVVPQERITSALKGIRAELETRLPELDDLAAHRLKQRTEYDLEMIQELGYCNGVENYSRYLEARPSGSPPSCLMDFFGDDFLVVVDESHVTIPQLHGMYKGDHARKENLVQYGFRLPSAFDNRPLKFEEIEKYFKNTVFMSATPGEYEFTKCLPRETFVVEQLIRPTGLIDPPITVKPTAGQIPDLVKEIQTTVGQGDRVFVTTLTKRMAEDLTDYLLRQGVKARYLHSEIDTVERTELLRQLRLGEFDVLVGINLLREGLDAPEVALVAILDADKEGFLRNWRSLIQTVGRAARNLHGRVLMYADKMTDSMKYAIDETNRRRTIQVAYNETHGITPKSIIKAISALEPEMQAIVDAKAPNSARDLRRELIRVETEMRQASESLDFERAIAMRDELNRLRSQHEKMLVDKDQRKRKKYGNEVTIRRK